MGRSEIFQRVLEILTPYAEDPALIESATMESHLADDLTVDSSHMVDASLEIEDEYQIEFEDEELAELKRMNHLLDMIEKKLAS